MTTFLCDDLATESTRVTDQKAIQTILHLVHAGELTLEEAVDRLIAIENAETLDSLIGRLGSPPDDIVAAWCEQLRLIASLQEAINGEPLPEIDLTQWAVTADGKLLLNQIRSNHSGDGPPASQVSLDRIDRFRSIWIAGSQRAPTSEPSVTKSSPGASPEGVQRNDGRSPLRHPTRFRAESTSTSRRRRIRLGAIAAIAIVAVVVTVLGFQSSSAPPGSIAQLPLEPESTNESSDSQSTADDAKRSTDDVDLPRATSDVADDQAEIVTLETFEPTDPLDSRDELELELSMSVDVRAPSLEKWNAELDSADRIDRNKHRSTPGTEPAVRDQNRTKSGPERSRSMQWEPKRSERKPPAPNPPTVQPPVDEQTDNASIPAESPQTVRRSPAMSIQLPEPSDVDTSVTLSDRHLADLQIAFPYHVPLVVTQQDDQWSIRDTEQNVPLAVIRMGADGSKLSWIGNTKRTSSVSALVHGRLIDARGHNIFLRPKFESDPWSFQLGRPDWLLTWNLGSTIAPGVTRLDVQFRLPEDLEHEWVDPIDPARLRREQGTAVIRVMDNQQVALAVRFDIRCHRKLHVRLRFAARLDRSMNWQRVAGPWLEPFHDQLIQRAAILEREVARLAKVHRSLHRRSEQSFIRDKQARVKELVHQNQLATKRVAELQTLMLRLESQARVGFRVWVEWPDVQQTILSAMPPVEMMGTSEPARESLRPE